MHIAHPTASRILAALLAIAATLLADQSRAAASPLQGPSAQAEPAGRASGQSSATDALGDSYADEYVLRDEYGNPFPPPRPVPPPFNAEIAATRFAELAMADVLMELALGEIAKRQGGAEAVKDLGHRMVTNHTAIRLILSKAAAAADAPVPDALTPEQQDEVDRIGALSGPDLDREYLWLMVERQPRAMAMYRWQYDNCDAATLKQFAVGTLPIIAVHARIADELHKKVNAEEIRLQERRAEAQRKADAERKAAEAAAAAAETQKKSQRRFKKS